MGSGLDCFSGDVLLLSFSPLSVLCAFFVVFPDVRTVKIIGQMVSPFSEDSSMGLTVEDFALTVAAGPVGVVGAFKKLVDVEDDAVECEALAGALGVA